MAVPLSEGELNTQPGTQQTTQAVFSGVELVTCVAADMPTLTSPQQLTSNLSGGQLAFPPNAPFLVHSPEFHAVSPPIETIAVTSDLAQVLYMFLFCFLIFLLVIEQFRLNCKISRF